MYNDENLELFCELKTRILIVRNVMIGIACSYILVATILAFLPKAYHIYRFIAVPIGIVLVGGLAAIKTLPLDNRNLKAIKKKAQGEAAHLAVSIMYLDYIHRKYMRVVIYVILSTVVIGLGLFWINPNSSVYFLSVVPVCYCLILLARKSFISQRIMNGVFGTNAREAKELIQFIRMHCDIFDFKDGDGNPRRVFLPENLLEASEKFPRIREVAT